MNILLYAILAIGALFVFIGGMISIIDTTRNNDKLAKGFRLLGLIYVVVDIVMMAAYQLMQNVNKIDYRILIVLSVLMLGSSAYVIYQKFFHEKREEQ